jgi:hypothetical protein
MSVTESGAAGRQADDFSSGVVEVEKGPPGSLSLNAYASGSGAILLAIGVAVFGMFLPTVIVPYAFSDDYPILSMAAGLGSSPWLGKNVVNAATVNGRPLAGLLDDFFFAAAGTIDNLRFIRLVAIVAIVAVALLLHFTLVRSGIGRIPAALIVVLVCSLPAFQVYSSWTVLVVAPFSALLGGGASLLARAAVDGPSHYVVDRVLGATAMLLAALLIYQPPAMFYWVFLAVAVFGVLREPRRALRIVGMHLGIAAVALALGFLVVKLGVHLVGKTAPNAGRNSLTHDVVGKLRWFAELPLYRSLNLFDLTPSLWFAVLVATVATGGILLLLRCQRARQPLLFVGIAAVLIPLSFLPNLVVGENSPTYRTEVSLSALIALYFCLGVCGILLTVRDWLKPRVSRWTLTAAGRVALAMSVAFVAASAFLASKNVTMLFVEPQRAELQLLRSQVAALPVGVTRVAFVQTGVDQGMAKLVLDDEYGVPSTAQPWTLEPSLLLILREEGRLPPQGQRPTVDALPPYTATVPSDVPVLDVRGLQRLR